MRQRNMIQRPTFSTAFSSGRNASFLAAVAVAVVGMAGCSEANTTEAGSAAVAESAKVVQADSASLAGQAGDSASAVVDPAAATSAPIGGDYVSAWGPATGSNIPMLAAADHQGKPQTLDSLAGEKGLLLVFSRSADW